MKLLFWLFIGATILLSGCAEDELEPLVLDNPYASYEDELSLEFISGGIDGGASNCRIIMSIGLNPDFQIDPSNVCSIKISKGFGESHEELPSRPISANVPVTVYDLRSDCFVEVYTFQLYDCEGFKAGRPLLKRITR